MSLEVPGLSHRYFPHSSHHKHDVKRSAFDIDKNLPISKFVIMSIELFQIRSVNVNMIRMMWLEEDICVCFLVICPSVFENKQILIFETIQIDDSDSTKRTFSKISPTRTGQLKSLLANRLNDIKTSMFSIWNSSMLCSSSSTLLIRLSQASIIDVYYQKTCTGVLKRKNAWPYAR